MDDLSAAADHVLAEQTHRAMQRERCCFVLPCMAGEVTWTTKRQELARAAEAAYLSRSLHLKPVLREGVEDVECRAL